MSPTATQRTGVGERSSSHSRGGTPRRPLPERSERRTGVQGTRATGNDWTYDYNWGENCTENLTLAKCIPPAKRSQGGVRRDSWLRGRTGNTVYRTLTGAACPGRLRDGLWRSEDDLRLVRSPHGACRGSSSGNRLHAPVSHFSVSVPTNLRPACHTQLRLKNSPLDDCIRSRVGAS